MKLTCSDCKWASDAIAYLDSLGQRFTAKDYRHCEYLETHVPLTVDDRPFSCAAHVTITVAPDGTSDDR